jgi:uncharacterized protein
MRLEPAEIVAIKACVVQVFGREASVLLFGSRTDDSKRGGDIDLLIVTRLTDEDMAARENLFRSRLTDLIGERRVDIVFHQAGTAPSAIADLALTTGIQL